MSNMPSKKVLIVGGVAGGATAAGRLRRLDETAQIILFERGPYVSFANCGLPYHIGGEIRSRQRLLLQTPAGLTARYNLDVRVQHEVLAIDRQRRCVRVRDLPGGREYDEFYDVLLLSPGAAPVRPSLPGADHPRVFTLRNVPDTDRIRAAVGPARSALVVGGGFIGLEMAENLRRRELAVTLVELLPQVLPTLDPEMAAPLHAELRRHAVDLRLEEAVTRFDDAAGAVRATLRSGGQVEADLAILAVGVRPDTRVARAAGLEVDERGAIVVDEFLRTSDPHIYAVGDAIQVRDAVLDQPTLIPLAGPANRQARIAADNIAGRTARYRGTQGTSIVRVFALAAGSTGASEKALQRAGRACRKAYVRAGHHVGYFPGAEPLWIKVLYAPEDGRVLGGQIVGAAGVDKRVDVLATAIQAGFTVYDLEELELAYAPQFGAAKDPLNLAGFVAANELRGDVAVICPEEVGANGGAGWTLLDVRDEEEILAGQIPGALPIPLEQLRERWRELPTDKPIAAYCATGQRSYYACRLLTQKGLDCRNLAGGYLLYNLVRGATVSTAPPCA